MNNQLLLIIIIIVIFFIYNSTNKSVKQQFTSMPATNSPSYLSVIDWVYEDGADAVRDNNLAQYDQFLGINRDSAAYIPYDAMNITDIDAVDFVEPFVGTGAFGCANLARRCVNAYDPVDATTAFANFYNIIDVDVDIDADADVNMTRDQLIDTFTGNKQVSNLSTSYLPGNAAVGVDAIKRAVGPYASMDFLDMGSISVDANPALGGDAINMGAVGPYASMDPVNISL